MLIQNKINENTYYYVVFTDFQKPREWILLLMKIWLCVDMYPWQRLSMHPIQQEVSTSHINKTWFMEPSWIFQKIV